MFTRAQGISTAVLVRLAWMTGLGLLAGGATGCTHATKDAGGSASIDVGSVKLALEPAPGVVFSSATYTLTGPPSFSRSDTIELSHSNTLSFVVGGVPAGSGYTIAIDATSTDGNTTCTGASAPFSAVAGQLVLVSLKLSCHEAPRTGSVNVNGQVNVCPVVDGIGANPAEVLVGGSIQLSALAHDSDQGPSPLAYGWTASSGVFSAPAAALSSFTCTEPGAVQIAVTVTDGDSAPGCADNAAVTITCTAAAPTDGGAGGAEAGTVGSDPVAASEADTDLAGKDGDRNGVRDDVDAYLVTLEMDEQKRTALTSFIRESTAMMILGGAPATARSTATEQAQRVGRTIDCLHDLYISNLAAKQAILRNLRSALYDNALRLRAYNHASTLVSGTLLRRGHGCDPTITGVSL